MAPVTQTEVTPTEPRTAEQPATPLSEGPKRWLLVPFAVLAMAMTFPYPSRLATYVPGDYGDSMFNLWVVRWIAHATPDGFGAIWDTNIFHPSQDTLTWSDPLLALVPVHWVLEQLTGSTALGFNLLYLLGWTLSLWFTYRLALHFTGRHGPSIVAGLVFTFAAPRLSHAGHWQLSTTGWMVPLILLLVVRYCQRPRLAVGLAIGGSLAALTVTSSYYGVMMALTVALVMAGYALVGRPRPLGRYLGGLAGGGLLALSVVAPVALRYLDMQDNPDFTRAPDPSLAAHPNDFLAPDQEAYLLADIPPFESRAFNRGLENRLFPGIVGLAFGAVGSLVLAGGLWRTRRGDEDRAPSGQPEAPSLDRQGARILLVMAGAALVMLALAFGRSLDIFGVRISMPYALLEDVVPGLASIRATSRFVIVGQCFLAVLAALGLARLLRRFRPRPGLLISLVLAGAVLAESATPAESARVPTDPGSLAVNEALAGKPPGVVVELPMGSPSDAWRWGFIEAPRMFLSTFDWHERVNGYSGYTPPGFDEQAADLESFPGPAAFERIDELGVRYVVLRTAPVGTFPPSRIELMGEDGVTSYGPETVEQMLAGLPAERVAGVERHGEAYLVEIRPP